jgi:membrane protease YdiL (CAAX protease family)
VRTVVRFYLLVFGISWAVDGLVIAVGGFSSAALILLYGLAWCSPALVAGWSVHREGGSPAVRRFFGQLLDWRPTPWHLAAALIPTLVLTAGAALGGGVPAWRVAFSPFAIGPPLAEEPGWRGYALPRLQAIWNPAWAALLTGFLWAAWHVPTWFIPGSHAHFEFLLPYVVFTTSAGVISAWLYTMAGGRLTVAVTFHLGMNLSLVPPSLLSLHAYELAAATMAVVAVAAATRMAHGTGRRGPV